MNNSPDKSHFIIVIINSHVQLSRYITWENHLQKHNMDFLISSNVTKVIKLLFEQTANPLIYTKNSLKIAKSRLKIINNKLKKNCGTQFAVLQNDNTPADWNWSQFVAVIHDAAGNIGIKGMDPVATMDRNLSLQRLIWIKRLFRNLSTGACKESFSPHTFHLNAEN